MTQAKDGGVDQPEDPEAWLERQLRAMSPEELQELALDVAAILRDIREFGERRRRAKARRAASRVRLARARGWS